MSLMTLGGLCFKHGAYQGVNAQCPRWPECADPTVPDLETEELQRAKVCAIARSWIGTPYHHMGRVKGAGVDCAMFPLEVYREAGLIEAFHVPYYPQDWMLHRSDEVYLGIVSGLATELLSCSAPESGDFVLYRFGRCFSHGAIVLDWPLVTHSLVGKGVILADGEREGCLVGRERKAFTLWK